MSYTYQAGFIGAGNMGGALALAAAKTAGGEQIAVSIVASYLSCCAVVGCATDAGYLHFLYIEISPYLGIAVFISTALGDVELAVTERTATTTKRETTQW